MKYTITKSDVVLAWVAKIRCHRLGGLNNTSLFSQVLEAGKSKL
jgi:hypothetical protein